MATNLEEKRKAFSQRVWLIKHLLYFLTGVIGITSFIIALVNKC